MMIEFAVSIEYKSTFVPTSQTCNIDNFTERIIRLKNNLNCQI